VVWARGGPNDFLVCLHGYPQLVYQVCMCNNHVKYSIDMRFYFSCLDSCFEYWYSYAEHSYEFKVTARQADNFFPKLEA